MQIHKSIKLQNLFLIGDAMEKLRICEFLSWHLAKGTLSGLKGLYPNVNGPNVNGPNVIG